MDDDAIKAGTILSGKYRVESILGSGGMGVVVRATQIDLDRPVAIKILLPEYREREDAVARFFREAKVAARIRGEHVAQVIDVAKADDGTPYIVMELLEGEDLATFIKREGRMPLELAVTFMLHACSAICDAHAARVIHRDIKPANLFLARQSNGTPALKVLDFGISRMDDQVSTLTHTTSSVGTAYYMSPEQIESPKSVDNRVDIWALGCVFHEFLVGETPFGGDAIPQIVSAVLRNARPKASKLVEGLPEVVDDVIDRCLRSERSERFQNVGELAVALAGLTNVPEHLALAAKIASRRVGLLALAETSIAELREPRNRLGPDDPTDLPLDRDPKQLSAGGVSVLSLSALGGVMEEDEEDAPRGSAGPLALELDVRPNPAPAPSVSASGVPGPVASAALVAPGPPKPSSPPKPPPPAAKPPVPVAHPPPNKPPSPMTLPSQGAAPSEPSRAPLVVDLSPPAPGEKLTSPPTTDVAPRSQRDEEVVDGRKVMRFLDMGDVSASPRIEVDPSALRKRKDAATVTRNPWPLRLLASFVVLLVLVLLLGIAGPRIAVSRVKSAAERAGIALSSDAPSISMRGWEFPNVQATFAALPGTTLHAGNVRASWTGAEMVVADVEIESTSELAAIERLVKMTDSAMPASFEVIDIKFHSVPVPAIELEGSGASFTSNPSSEGRKTQFLSPRTFVKTERMTLGPFGVNLERTPATARARIALDPVVPDGPSIIAVRHGGVIHLGADARRAPLARYGIPATFLGLPEGDNPDVELTMEAQLDERGNVGGNGTVALYGMKVGASAPIDASVAFRLEGTTDAVRVVGDEGKLGPFPAKMHGDWSRAAPTHLTLAFQSQNIGCADLARARAQKLAGYAGVSLSDLAKFTGTLGSVGQVSVALALIVDADIPPKVSTVVSSRDTCGLGIFAR